MAETLKLIQEGERLAWGLCAHAGDLSLFQMSRRKEILQGCMDGKYNAAEAALEFERAFIPLPETVRIVLAKNPDHGGKTEKAEDKVYTDEKLNAQFVKAMKGVDTQREKHMTERKKAVEKIKEEYGDKDCC